MMALPSLSVLLPAALAAVLAVVLGAVVVAARHRRRGTERLLRSMAAKLENLESQFGRFAPDEVVERLGIADGSYQPERREVTIMFADLRGFTQLCAGLDPMVIVDLLNGYFEHMNEAVARHHGTITELLGDGLLALFGALEGNPWQARDAVCAGLDMRAALAVYNGKLRGRGLPELRFGIGIHSGEMVAGVIGTDRLKKFSAVGDAINLASRVEGLTREFGVDLLITETVRAKLGDGFRLRAMTPEKVKGKDQVVATYHVEGLAAATRPESRAAEG